MLSLTGKGRINLQLNYPRDLDCIRIAEDVSAPRLHFVSQSMLAAWRATVTPAQADFAAQAGFVGKAGQTILLPGPDGIAGIAHGLGESAQPACAGGVITSLPPSTNWRLATAKDTCRLDMAAQVLGFCLGAYRFDKYRMSLRQAPPVLVLAPSEAADPAIAHSLRAARALWLARDLINEPANYLGPAELATVAAAILERRGAHSNVMTDGAVAELYPAVHAVGSGGSRKPVVLVARWSAPGADATSPLISICGKGICFDTGGYNLKPPVNMLRMKKDMGGAAVALALALLIMESELPCRVELRLACAENMISGHAMRPLDLVKMRSGQMVEIGNTDAEGRLVLADLLFEACEARPALLLDFATLTGAARVALGPDLPALFCNDDALSSVIVDSARAVHDCAWRLPLWDGYNSWLETPGADLNNVSEKPFAGAIIAALFLQRFVSDGVRWAHFDLYGWNDITRAGKPEGGEAQCVLAAFEAIARMTSQAAKAA